VTLFLGDVNTRARGLRTRLLSPNDLDRLAGVRSLLALQREMSTLGLIRADAPATPESLERAIRRRAAELMAILGRWCTDARRDVFSVVLEDEERRSIQAMLRGAEQAASAEARLSGLVPTVGLSERALRILADQPTTADVVRMLVVWSHPFAPDLVEALGGARPVLIELEIQVQRAFARRAIAHARRGGRSLLAYAQQVIDLMNAWSVLLHFPERADDMCEATFIEGGEALDRDGFAALFRSETFEEARRGLARTFRGATSPLVLDPEAASVVDLEASILRQQIEQQRKALRIRPDGPAPVLDLALSLRAEVLNLRRILWGIVLEAPPSLLQTSLIAS
jgi:vacuolar-type H+-ATPase subunit C/Vma6